MEAPMTNRTIKHEVKLQKSVIVILGILAFGVCANALAPSFSVKDAKASSRVQKVTLCNPSGNACGDGWIQYVRQR
jgi:hypothetical protein